MRTQRWVAALLTACRNKSISKMSALARLFDAAAAAVHPNFSIHPGAT
jgi:hypothetical protein